MQPNLGAAQEPEAQVEHLERQAVALRVLVLADVPPALQHTQQPVDRRRRLIERPG
jgi:hypothetical protein